MKDLATRRMRIGYENTLERFLWSACIVVSMVAGFLAGYLWRKPAVIEPPKIVAAPVSYCACPITSASNCLEVARMCVAQKRSMAVKP